jgi:hypothetical protein
MTLSELFAPVLKAVAALANNGGIFKKRKKQPLNLQLAPVMVRSNIYRSR